MTATLDGQALSIVDVGATSGLPQNAAAPSAQVSIFGKLADGTFELVILGVSEPARWFQSGADLSLDWTRATGLVFHYAAWQIPTLVGIVADGTLHLASAITTSGAPITGTFSAAIDKLLP